MLGRLPTQQEQGVSFHLKTDVAYFYAELIEKLGEVEKYNKL